MGIRSRAGTCTGRRSARTGRHVRARRLSLPATGFIHSAQALGGTSLHLTFGVHSAIERDIVKAVMKRLESSGWRASLPASWNPGSPEGHAQIQQVVDELREALTRRRASTRQLSARSAGHPATPGADRAAGSRHTGGEPDPADRLRLRHHVNPRTQEQPDKSITLVAAGQRLHVDARQLDALERMLSGEEFAVEDLPLPDDEALDLARRLLLAGIVTA